MRKDDAPLVRGVASALADPDRAAADEWGRMSAARPVSLIDGLLAATAKVLGLTLVTRNVAAVGDLGAAVLNPFVPREHGA